MTTANLSATLGVTLSYKNGEGVVTAITPLSVPCAYQSQGHGTIDVPDAETSATPHRIPFGSIDAATCAVVYNRTGQDLEVSVNGSDTGENLPAGGVYTYGGPLAPLARPLTGLCFKTTASQSGAGLIDFHLFGDPV